MKNSVCLLLFILILSGFKNNAETYTSKHTLPSEGINKTTPAKNSTVFKKESLNNSIDEKSINKASTGSGNALAFNGENNNYVNMGNVLGGMDNFTISAWIKPTNISGQKKMIISKYGGNDSREWYIAYNNSEIRFFHYNDTYAISSIIEEYTFNSGQWYQVTATYDETNIKLYVNGELIGTEAQTNGTNTTTAKLKLGWNDSFWSHFQYNGEIDEVRIWSKALTKAEIQANMNGELQGDETGLELYYTMNQGVPCGDNTNITSLLDKAGNHNGNLINFSLGEGNCTSNFVKSTLASPVLSKTAVSEIKLDGAKFTSNIISTGWCNNVTERGFIYSTIQNPTHEDFVEYETGNFETGEYSASLSGLEAGTVYYVRSFASNENGTSYGKEVFFYTSMPGSGNALAFDGVQDYVNAGDVLSGMDNFTISMWINPYNITSQSKMIISKYGGSDNREWYIAHNDSEIRLYHYNKFGSVVNLIEDYTFNTGQWHHIAATYDETNIKLYVNGELIGTEAQTSGTNTTTAQLMLGWNHAFWSFFQYNGEIDEVRVWSKALTKAEIQAKMNGELHGNETGLELYYTMNQGIPCGDNKDINTLFDKTGNHHGALIKFSLEEENCISNFVKSTIGNARLFLDSVEEVAGSVIAAAKITDIGWSDHIAERGFCYSTSQNPTIEDDKVSETGSFQTGEYSLSLDNIASSATYYIRAFAINENGIQYSNSLSFNNNLDFPQITGFDDILYLERDTVLVAPNVTLYEGGSYCGGFIRFETENSSYTETLSFIEADNPTDEDVISAEGNTIYIGVGSGEKVEIGTLGDIENGQSGNSLKISMDYETYNNTTGIKDSQGNAAKSNIEEVITQGIARLVTYNNSSCNPSELVKIEIAVMNSAGGVGNAEANINVILRNCPPVVNVNPLNPAYIQGASRVFLAKDTDADPIEPNQKILEFGLMVENLLDGDNEILIIDGVSFPLVHGISGYTNNNLEYYVNMESENVAKIDFFTENLLEPEDFNNIINNLQYNNSSNNITDGDRVISIAYLKDSGGTENEGEDTNEEKVVMSTIYYNPEKVVIVVLDDNGLPLPNAMINISYDNYATNVNGQLILELPDGNYNVTATAEGYEDNEEELFVENNTGYLVLEMVRYYFVTLTIQDQDNNTIEDARVQIDGEEYISDEIGQVSLLLRRGEYNVTIIAEGYPITNTTIAINDDENIIITISSLAAPLATEATELTSASFIANWEDVTGGAGYLLDVSKDSDFDEYHDDYESKDVGDVLSFKVTNLQPGTTYFYRVRAYNDNGDIGPSSNTIEAKSKPVAVIFVFDLDNNSEPLINTSVMVNEDEYCIDEKGKIKIDLNAGTHELVFSKPNFQTLTENLFLPDGAPQIEMDLYMFRSPIALDDDVIIIRKESATVDMFLNDQFVDPSTLEIVEYPVDGAMLNVNTDNTVTLDYINRPEFLGYDSFIYRVRNFWGEDYAEAEVSIKVVVDEKGESLVYTPSGFSPNGNGINDTYVIPGIKNFPDNEFIVYNRWGNEVFRMKGYDNLWDGKLKSTGKDLSVGTYFFVLKLGKDLPVMNGYIYLAR